MSYLSWFLPQAVHSQLSLAPLQGNLGWAYMQLMNYTAAEVVYRKAQEIDPDANKACNLCLCLTKQERFDEARAVLEEVMQGVLPGSDDIKSRHRSDELLKQIETYKSATFASPSLGSFEDAFMGGLDQLMNNWNPSRSRRLPIFEEIISHRDQLACWCLFHSVFYGDCIHKFRPQK